MEKEFEDYWSRYQKQLIYNAPQQLREEYMESTRLASPIDWVCYVIPVAIGIILQPRLRFASEIVSWAIVVLVVVVVFALLQMLKPLVQKKKSTIQVVENIKQYYYAKYKKVGLDKLEPWK